MRLVRCRKDDRAGTDLPAFYRRGGGAVIRGDWRIPGVVVLLLGWMVAVIAIPLGRTLFELSELPWWQYFLLFAVAVVWSLLCRVVWRTR